MLLCMLAPGSRPAAAEALRCPDRLSEAPLADVTLFDGPPAEHADLMPDGEVRSKGGTESHWDVAYVARSGRHVFIECRYGAGAPALTIEGGTVTSCTFTSRRDGRRAMACR